ncbi:ribbon-helix-helix protein, CopG family (plasmid) [Aureimonas ureilytica]|uniref:ribbon-helix-helix protein, CopG family n=1 Tax=Aureimonas ureilytica TaxID=401562 RepID=UPI003CE8D279
MSMPRTRNRSEDAARIRARRRAEGLLSIEAVLHRDEIAALDQMKARLGVASRSDVLRIVLAKVDQDAITPADAATLSQSAA